MNTYIVVGLSAAGIGALNALRNLDPDATIIGISDQPDIPYNKCILVDYCIGLKTRDELTILSAQKAHEKRIQLLLGVRVETINSHEKSITLSDGRTLQYTKLFLGIGTRPLVPSFINDSLQGIFTFHTLADADAILAYVERFKVQKAVVIGAGLSGLECADALTTRGLEVCVVDRSDKVLQYQIQKEASDHIVTAMASHNANFYGNNQIKNIIGTQDKISSVVLSTGHEIAADLVVVAIGARPASELAVAAGIAVHEGGIVTNEYMQTSIPDIYAGGDVALVTSQITGERVQSCIWPDAMHQGLIAAHAMAGKPKPYPGALIMTSSAFFGLKFASCGAVVNPPATAEVIKIVLPAGHQTFVLNQGRLVGFALVGDISAAGTLKRMVLTREFVCKEAFNKGF